MYTGYVLRGRCGYGPAFQSLVGGVEDMSRQKKKHRVEQEPFVALAQPLLRGYWRRTLIWTIPFLLLSCLLMSLQAISPSVGGLALTFWGAVLLAKQALPSDTTIREIASTKGEGDPSLYANLVKNRNWAYWGVGFIMGGFLAQGIGMIV